MRNKTVYYGGFGWQESANTRDEIQAHRLYKGLGGASFDLLQFSDAQKPFVLLCSDDPVWIQKMRKMIAASAEIQRMNEAYNVEVRVEWLTPQKPVNRFFGTYWDMLVKELFPLR